ncbi:glycosyltransferase [Photobacterium damselae]|uniref:glycosyltransferase n=1 Tax=Photobacterium damselae TaxID=38293 RepID=UPI001247DA46|nr:glycosyltransferase [Photobacterium damselae]KAB1182950.1 glycosyltransferase family 2 protein [Photobacterium damselae subsp. damselae]MBF7101601.1 glycosyltransferase [Photobacterium damselae]
MLIDNLITTPSFRNKKNRLKFDEEVGDFHKILFEKKHTLPSISAIYRVKNASSFLECSILSVAPICNEIIIVDNGSSDDTLVIANKLKDKLSGVCSVKIFEYNKKLAIAGDNYRINLTSDSSLANFYSYCFSLASSDYVMKCDAHLIYLPSALRKIQKKLESGRRVIIYKGIEIFGMKLSFERYIFKNDNSFMYRDGDLYEELVFDYNLSKLEQIKSMIFSPCFIHIKRLQYINNIGSKNLVEQLYK